MWYENALINLTGGAGHFMSLDEACEITVDSIKHDFNPRGSWQSREFHMETVSPNVNLCRDIRRQMMKSSGASTYGSKHAAVDISKDTELVIRVLLDNKVMCYTPGRASGMVGGEKRRYREVVDALGIGRDKLKDEKIPVALSNIESLMAQSIDEGSIDEGGLQYYDEDLSGGFISMDGFYVDIV